MAGAADQSAPSAAGPRTAMTGESAFDDLVATLQAAAEDRTVGRRLAMGQTTVHLRITRDGEQALTMLLDREPIEVLEGVVGEAEVDIALPADHLERLWEEDYHLAMAIAKGEVQYSGPVRKYLRVMPILQKFSRRLHGREPEEDVVEEDYGEEWR